MKKSALGPLPLPLPLTLPLPLPLFPLAPSTSARAAAAREKASFALVRSPAGAGVRPTQADTHSGRTRALEPYRAP